MQEGDFNSESKIKVLCAMGRKAVYKILFIVADIF